MDVPEIFAYKENNLNFQNLPLTRDGQRDGTEGAGAQFRWASKYEFFKGTGRDRDANRKGREGRWNACVPASLPQFFS